mmetsp:Transcript_26114/g.72861  ORF Transcript_26114/g.72861 Transcript_26114/m.72861 type:complete len:204 (-) Transcript_26114:202-813(-)
MAAAAAAAALLDRWCIGEALLVVNSALVLLGCEGASVFSPVTFGGCLLLLATNGDGGLLDAADDAEGDVMPAAGRSFDTRLWSGFCGTDVGLFCLGALLGIDVADFGVFGLLLFIFASAVSVTFPPALGVEDFGDNFTSEFRLLVDLGASTAVVASSSSSRVFSQTRSKSWSSFSRFFRRRFSFFVCRLRSRLRISRSTSTRT